MCLLGLLSQAHAQPVPGYPDNIRGFDPREIAMLPKYCIYTQDFREHVPGGNDPAAIDQWYSVMGEMFQHMHHYCYGLMKTNRAMYLVRDAQSRKYYLQATLGEFDYVLGHAREGFILTPEILARKGENLMRLGQVGQAIEALEQAAQIKPDYWPPYATMSDYYKDTGDYKKARKLLETGLSFAPDAKALKRRLDELDTEEAKKKNGSQVRSSKVQR